MSGFFPLSFVKDGNPYTLFIHEGRYRLSPQIKSITRKSFFLACRKGDLFSAKRILEHKDYDQSDLYNDVNTALGYSGRFPDLFNFLLARPEVNLSYENLAVRVLRGGNLKVVKALLSYRRDKTLPPQIPTRVKFAIEIGGENIYREGEEVQVTPPTSINPFEGTCDFMLIAAYYGYLDILKYLIEIGGDIYAGAIYAEDEDENEDVLERCLSEIGESCNFTNYDLAKYLLGIVNYISPTVYRYIVGACTYGGSFDNKGKYRSYLEIIKPFVEVQERINGKAWKGMSYALSNAVRNLNFDLAQFFIEKGEKLGNVKKSFDNACSFGILKLARFLLPFVSQLELDFGLGLASEYGRLEVLRFLTSQGADVTADNNYAVGMASENGHLEVVKLLVSQGADVSADSGYAFKAAQQRKNKEVVKFLSLGEKRRQEEAARVLRPPCIKSLILKM